MPILKFLFGSGWWIAWYLTFYAAILMFVVLILFIFGQEVKPPGAKPATPSPGSFMVLMIALTLAFFTFVNAILFVNVFAAPWYVKVLPVLVATAVVAVLGFKLNIQLAEAQSRSSLIANIVYASTTILANLVMMWFIQARAFGSIRLTGA